MSVIKYYLKSYNIIIPVILILLIDIIKNCLEMTLYI